MLLTIVFLAGLCCWLLFFWQVCVVGYCFPDRFVLLAIVFLSFMLLTIVFLAGLCCWLMFSCQVCVVSYCFPGRFVLAISLSGLFFQAGLCWLSVFLVCSSRQVCVGYQFFWFVLQAGLCWLSVFLVCSSRQVYVVGYSLCWFLFCRDSSILHVLLGKFVLTCSS